MSFFIIIIICASLYFCYNYLVKPSFYWQERGVFHVKLWSSRFFKMFLGSKSFPEIVKDAYDEFPNRRYYGGYQLLKPSLFLRDLDLIKRITVKDFDHFPDHTLMSDEQTDPLMGANLFSLKGERWKDMRATLSPAFTSSKMRAMYELISETSENFTRFFWMKNKEGVIEMEMKEVFSKYATDIIANCAFGIKCNSLENAENEFFTMGQALTKFTSYMFFRRLLMAFFPAVFRLFRIGMFPKKITNFFQSIIMDTISTREKNHIIRPDMIHLLMEARKGRLNHETTNIDKPKEGFATVEEFTINKNVTNKIQLTDNVITAQALIFFFAGFETSATLMSFLAYELAVNPDIQQKLQEEIDVFHKKNNDKISYDDISKMKYLDQVISETLRKYPPGFVLNRLCVKNYPIPAKNPNENDIVLEKDCLVVVPVYAIHHDPNYFPNPNQFDPERFSEENKDRIVSGSYLPFGSGPRNCIASRFALLETKALITSLLLVFDLVPTEKTVIPIRFSREFSMGSKDGFWLGFKRRNFDNKV